MQDNTTETQCSYFWTIQPAILTLNSQRLWHARFIPNTTSVSQSMNQGVTGRGKLS
jgi:hypothetical protein